MMPGITVFPSSRSTCAPAGTATLRRRPDGGDLLAANDDCLIVLRRRARAVDELRVRDRDDGRVDGDVLARAAGGERRAPERRKRRGGDERSAMSETQRADGVIGVALNDVSSTVQSPALRESMSDYFGPTVNTPIMPALKCSAI